MVFDSQQPQKTQIHFYGICNIHRKYVLIAIAFSPVQKAIHSSSLKNTVSMMQHPTILTFALSKSVFLCILSKCNCLVSKVIGTENKSFDLRIILILVNFQLAMIMFYGVDKVIHCSETREKEQEHSSTIFTVNYSFGIFFLFLSFLLLMCQTICQQDFVEPRDPAVRKTGYHPQKTEMLAILEY